MNEKDDIHFQRIVNTPRRGIGDKTIATLLNEAQENHVSMIQYIRDIENYSTDLKPKTISLLRDLVNSLDYASDRITKKDDEIHIILNDLLNEIGYRAYLKLTEEKAEEKIENVDEYINNIKVYFKDNKDATLVDYLQNVSLTSSQDEIDDNEKVNLMTVHTAKGLEFPYVFIAGFNNDVFPNARAVEDKKRGGIEEERRLAFVAFTRAKKRLYITYNHDYNYVTGENKEVSDFVKEAGLKPVTFFSSQHHQSVFTPKPRTGEPIRIGGGPSNSNSHTGFVRPSNNDGNGISWHVGDVCNHKNFGRGVVKEVDGDKITVDFDTQGEKKLRGSHPFLSKNEA